MASLAETLERFNRKERHWLIRDALGPASARLDDCFRRRLEKATGIPVSADAWWAMDYHLNWLVAALCTLQQGEGFENATPNLPGAIRNNQQDIDLIVASGSTLLLIEAKGVGQWAGPGLKSKIERLSLMAKAGIISENGDAGSVSVRFVLCSPQKPGVLDIPWPSYGLDHNGKPLFVQMNVKVPEKGFLKVDGLSADGTWRMTLDREANRSASAGPC